MTRARSGRTAAKQVALAALLGAIVAVLSILVEQPAVGAVRTSPLEPCTGRLAAVAAQRDLSSVARVMVDLPDSPFGVVAIGDWVFVSGNDDTRAYVAVLSTHGGTPTLIRMVKLPALQASGASLTPDGRYLIVAGGDRSGSKQAIVLSVDRLEHDRPHPVLGILEAPITAVYSETPVSASIEVTSSKDGRFVFVSEEGPGEIAVFDLHHALATGFASSSYVGSVPVDDGVVGIAVSPDGRTLYATSEKARNSWLFGDGTLSVINVRKAESRPQDAVVSTVDAGCTPVRVAVSPKGNTVWVTARGSNQLLAFSGRKLIRDPKHALLAAVRVGEEPVGVATFDSGQRIAVADSNRGNVTGRTSGLTIVNANAALGGTPGLIGEVPAGRFPRDLTVDPTGTTLLVANYDSGQLEAVDLQDVG